MERSDLLASRALQIWRKPTTTIPIKDPQRARQSYDVTVLELIEAGYLFVGEKLYSSIHKYPGTALIDQSGGINYGEESGLSPSRAGELCIHNYNPKVSKPNGWIFWSVERDGILTTLEDIRDEYLGR